MPDLIPNAELVLFVNSLFPSSFDWDETAAKLKEYEKAYDDVQAGWLMTAFDYMLRRGIKENRKDPEVFSDQWATSVSVYPVPLGQLPVEVANFWSEIVVRVDAPQCVARLHHLLFELKHGNGGEHARKASSAYLELGISDWTRLDRVNCLYWSVELSRRVGDTADRVIAPLVELAELSLDKAESEPGVALHALEVLTREVPSLEILPTLLGRARLAYPDPRLVAITMEMQAAIAKGDDGSRIVELHRELVRESIDFALQREGIAKMKFLEEAAQLATKYGEKELLKEAMQAMQAMTIEELDLKRISVEVEIPSGVIEVQVERVVNQSSLDAAFNFLVLQSPPSGNIYQNTEMMKTLSAEFVFQDLIPTTLLRSDALASYTPINDEDARDQKLSHVEVMNLGLGSEIVSRIFVSLLARFTPNPEEIGNIIGAADHVDSSTARSLSRVFLAFQEGEFEVAATLAIPKIETLARARLAKMGNLQYQVQRGSKRGVYPQLGTLIRDLRPSLDPSWYRFLLTFLVSNFGPNYRNELSHGYVEEVDIHSSAMVLLSALYLALMPVEIANVFTNE